jgi:hypothetical protein
MIETHVMNALLLPAVKLETPFKILTFVNGLVAPSFLFCAGLAFAVSFHRKWSEYVSAGKTFWRYAVRMVFILGVAYSLHLPFFSLSRMRALPDEQAWIPFFQVDILQVIAVTLLLMAVLTLIARKEVFFYLAIAGLSLGIIFSSPPVRELDYSQVSIWLRPYFTMQYRSQFPLFPWAAFLMGGALVGYYFLRAHERGNDALIMKRLTVAAAVMIAASLVAEILPFTVYPHHDFWRASPEFFFVRLSIIILVLALLWRLTWKKVSSSVVILTLGQESLLVYTVHLLVVYGYTYEFSFVRLFGPELNYVQCLGLFAGLTIAMVGMAFVWHRMKRWNMRIAKIVQTAVLAGIVLTFLLK